MRTNAPENQHAGLDLADQVADGRPLYAMNTPGIIQNFDLNIAGDGFPDFFRLWCK